MSERSKDPGNDLDGPGTNLEQKASYDQEADRVVSARQQAGHAARAQAEEQLKRLNYVRQAEPSKPQNAEPFPAIVGVLAARGWAVFPLDGKIPFKGSSGFKDATTDLAQLRRSWTGHPGANWGIATGRVSGIVVLDTDGLAGERALRDLLGGDPPATLMIETARGHHYYFKYPPGTFPTLAAEALGPKLDTKGDVGRGRAARAPGSHRGSCPARRA